MQLLEKQDIIDVEDWSARHPSKPPPRCRRFQFRIDKERFVTTDPEQRQEDLLDRVGKCPDEWRLFQLTRGGERLKIMPGEVVDLRKPGIERFRTKPKFFVCIEGDIHPWPRRSITTEEIAQLGGWDPSQGVIQVDEDQSERTLEPGEEVELKPGISFGKKVCWKRGSDAGTN